MPTCTKAARGTTAGASPPFDDAIDSNPCGKLTVATVNGVSVATHACCLPHLVMKLGWAAISGPVVISTS